VRLDRCAGLCREHLCDCVGLLRADAALLDRELRHVARRVGMRHAVNAAAQVGGYEAVLVLPSSRVEGSSGSSRGPT